LKNTYKNISINGIIKVKKISCYFYFIKQINLFIMIRSPLYEIVHDYAILGDESYNADHDLYEIHTNKNDNEYIVLPWKN
jgi:hypothetical protein